MALGLTGMRLLDNAVAGHAFEAMRCWPGELEDESTSIIQYPVALSALQSKKCDPASKALRLSVPELDTQV